MGKSFRIFNPPSIYEQSFPLLFHMSDDERESYGIKTLPPNLGVALEYLEKDKVIRSAIGEGVASAFLKIKRNEWREYVNFAITDWEWQLYSDN